MKKYCVLFLLVLFCASCTSLDDINWQIVTAEELKELIDDANEQDSDGNTPLMYAAKYNNSSVVEALIKEGADVNAQNEDGKTALMTAIEYGRFALVETLIKAGADANIRDENGNTPLMYAAEYGDTTVFDALIEAGADMNVRNREGETAQMIKEERERSVKNGRRGRGSIGLNGLPFLFLK